MNYNKEKINDIIIENHIWIIYIIIIFASWYSNSLEKAYFLTNNLNCKIKYRQTLIKIFSILLIIYLYFLVSSLKDVSNLKNTDNLKKKKLNELAAIASLLIFVSGIIFLYIAYMDKDIDVEIAFN